MRKKAALLLIITLSLFNILLPIQARESTNEGEIEQTRKDYLFQYSNYVEAHKEYLTSKNAYNQFGTIEAQKEAIKKTKKTLVFRSEVLRTYLQLLKVILDSKPALNPELHNSQFGKLEATQSFILTHKENIVKAQSINEINSASQRFEREANQMNELAYETLSVLLIEEIQDLENKTRLIIDQMAQSAKAQENQEIGRGISEINKKLINVRLTTDRANQTLIEYQTDTRKRKSASKTYSAIKKEIEAGKEIMTEIIPLIKELNRKVNYG